MRILFFNRSALPIGGGMNRLAIDTARRLRRAGHEVALVHSREGGQFDGTGYIYDDLDYRLMPRDEKATRLEAIIEDFSPDVIQLHGVGNTLLDGWLAARKPTVRFVHNHNFYCSGRMLTLQRPAEPCRKAHGRACCFSHVLRGCGSANPAANFMRYRAVDRSLRALRSLHGLQVMSESVARQLEANGVPPEKVVRLPLYAPVWPAADAAPSSSLRTILHVGGLLGHKGVWMVVRMLRDLPGDVQLVLAGGGKDKEVIEEHVRRRGLGARVRIVGEPTPEQWSFLYRESTLVVMPVLWNEPLGLEGLAAMSHGKPVVAFGTEGIRQWLRHGETGVCVDFGDRAGFRVAVRELIDDRARLRDLGRKAREIWRENFSPQRHIGALLEHYDRVIAEAKS
jgi:glycosyltransferase involved in cell wall biosynthesis